MVLDWGQTNTGCTIALFGFWIGVALILLRRPHKPTRGDLVYIRFGIPVMVFLTVPIYYEACRQAIIVGGILRPR